MKGIPAALRDREELGKPPWVYQAISQRNCSNKLIKQTRVAFAGIYAAGSLMFVAYVNKALISMICSTLGRGRRTVSCLGIRDGNTTVVTVGILIPLDMSVLGSSLREVNLHDDQITVS